MACGCRFWEGSDGGFCTAYRLLSHPLHTVYFMFFSVFHWGTAATLVASHGFRKRYVAISGIPAYLLAGLNGVFGWGNLDGGTTNLGAKNDWNSLLATLTGAVNWRSSSKAATARSELAPPKWAIFAHLTNSIKV